MSNGTKRYPDCQLVELQDNVLVSWARQNTKKRFKNNLFVDVIALLACYHYLNLLQIHLIISEQDFRLMFFPFHSHYVELVLWGLDIVLMTSQLKPFNDEWGNLKTRRKVQSLFLKNSVYLKSESNIRAISTLLNFSDVG